MKTVYAVSSGDYSDYRVVAIFSTKEKAKEYMERVPSGSYSSWNDIEEYDLDPDTSIIAKGYIPYLVWMLYDGSVERISREELHKYNFHPTAHAHVWQRTQASAYRGKGVPDALDVRCMAKDEKHAIKIANEQRAMFIADGRFKPHPSAEQVTP